MNKSFNGSAALASGFINKLNDAGVLLQSVSIGSEIQYLMTRDELEFDEKSKSIYVSKKIGIGVAFNYDVPKSVVTRVLSAAIVKMMPPRGDDMFAMFTYKGGISNGFDC